MLAHAWFQPLSAVRVRADRKELPVIRNDGLEQLMGGQREAVLLFAEPAGCISLIGADDRIRPPVAKPLLRLTHARRFAHRRERSPVALELNCASEMPYDGAGHGAGCQGRGSTWRIPAWLNARLTAPPESSANRLRDPALARGAHSRWPNSHRKCAGCPDGSTCGLARTPAPASACRRTHLGCSRAASDG